MRSTILSCDECKAVRMDHPFSEPNEEKFIVAEIRLDNLVFHLCENCKRRLVERWLRR